VTLADKARVTKRAFLFGLQDGLCYLGITPACRERGRAMRLNGKQFHRATIEHVVPRCKMKPGDVELVLVACAACNTLKADQDPLDPIHVTKAEAYRAEWIEYQNEQNARAAKRRADKKDRRRNKPHEADVLAGLPYPTVKISKEGRAASLGVAESSAYFPGAKRSREKHPRIPLGSAHTQMLATVKKPPTR